MEHRNKKQIKSFSNKLGWDSDAERLILYADFMGFTHRVLSNDHSKLKGQLNEFKAKWTKKMEPLQTGDHLRFVQFSDSILIVANGIDEQMFNLISKAAINLVHAAMSLKFPIKGVIAQGTFSFDKKNELYFGRPLVDAYLLHEHIKYYGIVVHNTAERTVKNFQNRNNPYIHSEIYIDKGKVSHYHLCWNLINTQLSADDITPQCLEWLELIEEDVSGEPRQYIDRTKEVLQNNVEYSSPNSDDVSLVKDSTSQ